MALHKHHYFYKITNLINGKYYYGIHSTNDLDDGYMGSGKALKASIKKYGLENFSKEILKFFDTIEELSDYEKLIVNEKLLEDPNCYNMVKGGYFLSDEDVLKLKSSCSRSQMGSKNSSYNTCWIIKNDISIKIPKSELQKYIDDGWVQGRKIIDKTKILKANQNRAWIWKDGISKQINKEDLQDYLNNGWVKGRSEPKIKQHLGKGHNLKSLNTNTILVKDKDGNRFRVKKDDPRYLSGELVAHNRGMINAYDTNGNKFYISIDDPRYLSGELISQSKYHMHDKVIVKDSNGNNFCVDKNDPRYLSGELKPITTGRKRPKKERENISKAHRARYK